MVMLPLIKRQFVYLQMLITDADNSIMMYFYNKIQYFHSQIV